MITSAYVALPHAFIYGAQLCSLHLPDQPISMYRSLIIDYRMIEEQICLLSDQYSYYLWF